MHKTGGRLCRCLHICRSASAAPFTPTDNLGVKNAQNDREGFGNAQERRNIAPTATVPTVSAAPTRCAKRRNVAPATVPAAPTIRSHRATTVCAELLGNAQKRRNVAPAATFLPPTHTERLVRTVLAEKCAPLLGGAQSR
ncbi:hypothetical protein V502_08094 [Pseudogymnoascus sp. VKM F-4520 (FW-2644)]|nr:hypothetical protein V502_08094 [Pseudogymnoascus sp. VKM F-4520 (FW-2644)]